MALPEIKSTMAEIAPIESIVNPGNAVETTEVRNNNPVMTTVSEGNQVLTTHNAVPQVLTVVQQDSSYLSTIVKDSWESVWSVNGQTGDVIVDVLATDFRPNTTYKKDAVIVYEGDLYRAVDNITTGATFDPTQWEKIVTGGEQKQADWAQNDDTESDFIKNKPTIPANTSDLVNDSNFPSDADYVHTDNNFTTEEKQAVEQHTADITELGTTVADIAGDIEEIDGELATMSGAISGIDERATSVESKIPAQATSANQLADKAFVNSSVQTATANFRGSWNTWSDVPTDASLYPADYSGTTKPGVNDYLVVVDASGYPISTLAGTWRFKYSGTWDSDGTAGWHPEYQVNETPMTAAQLAALNSGITAEKISATDAAIADKVDKITGKGLSTNDYTTAEKTKLAGLSNAKLYSETGQNTDGAMTQKAVTDALSGSTGNGNVFYATCSTAAATAAKVATTSTGKFTLTTGATVFIKMTYGNTAAAPTLKIDNKTAKSIKAYGTTNAQNFWQTGEVICVVYDGTNFIMTEGGPATTSTYGVTKLSSATDSTDETTAATSKAVNTLAVVVNGMGAAITGKMDASALGFTPKDLPIIRDCQEYVFDGVDIHDKLLPIPEMTTQAGGETIYGTPYTGSTELFFCSQFIEDLCSGEWFLRDRAEPIYYECIFQYDTGTAGVDRPCALKLTVEASGAGGEAYVDLTADSYTVMGGSFYWRPSKHHVQRYVVQGSPDDLDIEKYEEEGEAIQFPIVFSSLPTSAAPSGGRIILNQELFPASVLYYLDNMIGVEMNEKIEDARGIDEMTKVLASRPVRRDDISSNMVIGEIIEDYETAATGAVGDFSITIPFNTNSRADKYSKLVLEMQDFSYRDDENSRFEVLYNSTLPGEIRGTIWDSEEDSIRMFDRTSNQLVSRSFLGVSTLRIEFYLGHRDASDQCFCRGEFSQTNRELYYKEEFIADLNGLGGVTINLDDIEDENVRITLYGIPDHTPSLLTTPI